VAAAIHADVWRRGYDRELGSFVQSYGSKQLDASLLLLPIIGFLPAEDPRVRGTLRAVERRLLVDGLVRRYDTAGSRDGLPAGEGAFLACSFWLVDAYVMQHRWHDARVLFRRLLDLQNDVGLLSEEYDPSTRRLVGNFPQAFTHVALVNIAFNLSVWKTLRNIALSRCRRAPRPRRSPSNRLSEARGDGRAELEPLVQRRRSPVLAQGGQEMFAPRIEIVVRNDLVEHLMARPPLFQRH
jgi:glycosyl hydrolase family 15